MLGHFISPRDWGKLISVGDLKVRSDTKFLKGTQFCFPCRTECPEECWMNYQFKNSIRLDQRLGERRPAHGTAMVLVKVLIQLPSWYRLSEEHLLNHSIFPFLILGQEYFHSSLGINKNIHYLKMLKYMVIYDITRDMVPTMSTYERCKCRENRNDIISRTLEHKAENLVVLAMALSSAS